MEGRKLKGGRREGNEMKKTIKKGREGGQNREENINEIGKGGMEGGRD